MNDERIPDPGIDNKADAPKKSDLNGLAKPGFTGSPDDLHDLIGSNASDSEDPLAGLRDNPDYAALIRDLEYIASQVKEILKPAEESPSEALWDKIKNQLPHKPDA